VLLLFPIILPDYLESIDIISNISVLIVGIMFIYLLVFNFIKKDINIFVIVSVIFFVWRMFSSYYLTDGVMDLVNSIRIITLILFLNLVIKRFPKSTLKALSTIFGLYIVINFITLLIFPKGLYLTDKFSSGWFLGIENQFAVFLVPGTILIVISSWYNHKKISTLAWLQIVITLLTVLKIWSATAIVAIIFVVASIMLIFSKKLKNIYNFSMLGILYVALWLILVRFNSIESFQTIIVDILGKDMTLSFRTRIWEVIIDIIPDSFWYGFGINTSVLAGVETHFVAHNMILQTILDSGIIGLLLFLICVLISGTKLQKYKKYNISALLLIGVFGILIGGLTESYRFNYLFLLLVLSYNVKYINQRYELNKK